MPRRVTESDPTSSRQGLWAFLWLLFTAGWAFAAVFTLAVTDLVSCGGDGGAPYADPASPLGRYCAGWDDVLGRSRGFVAVALAVALLLAAGFVSIRRRRPWLLIATGAVAVGLLVAHFAVVSALSPE